MALSAAQRTELWSRWKAGQSLPMTEQAFPILYICVYVVSGR